MKFQTMAVALATGVALSLAGCQSLTYNQFRQNPKAVSKAQLCRTLVETQDIGFARLIVAELARRGIDYRICPAMVMQQNQAAATVAAVALAGTAVAVCTNYDCSAPGYGPSSYRTYDGNCQHPWQRDIRGNRCGARSADSRPGGR